ncbi:hypothetical protein FGO68_gene7304 [Halteria grandinella]|uniref:Uncharacterized protein n=1 Tax=Halteria grandinella TaxID=5974 RepID=A0A8J8P3T2_HALGN|nr:hypothetical protein FGO68_gene7304 [Halteria grandinella]
MDGDGCSRQCKIEMGFECSINGSKDQCKEVCGDGIVRNLACDDGNSEPNDGCSPTCTIEIGWNCTTTGNNPSLCTKIDSPYLTTASLEKDNSQLTLYFSSEIRASENLTKENFNLKIINNPLTDPVELNWTIIPNDQVSNSILLKLNIKGQLYGIESIEISIMDVSHIYDPSHRFPLLYLSSKIIAVLNSSQFQGQQ